MAKKVIPKTRKAKRAKVKTVMDEWKHGKLHSGSKHGPKVTSQKQAVAIALSQSGQSRNKHKNGITRRVGKSIKVGKAFG